MPQLVKEITQGQSRSRATGGGQNAPDSGSAARVFRVILSQPGETFDPVETCGVSIGSEHPADSDYLCRDYSVAYEGESRSVVAVTFNYALVQDSNGNQDQPPDQRPANWSLSSALMEVPCTKWRRFRAPASEWGDFGFPQNPAGDIYDNVTAMVPVVTITITQYCVNDPTDGVLCVGNINKEEIVLGSLTMKPHTVMLRSVQTVPTIETFGEETYRGWTATWEFAYRTNYTKIHRSITEPMAISPGKGDQGEDVAIGWDIAVPVTGHSAIARDPAGLTDANGRNNSEIDVYAQPLRHGKEDSEFYGRIEKPLALPDDVVAGTKQRAMVRVFSYENGGASQTPAALPVPLNADGTPRNTEPFADGSRYYPIVWRYQIHDETNFTTELGLRLF